METKQQILASLMQLISEQFGVNQDAIALTTTWTQLGADSLDRLAISMAIEETFHVEIPHHTGERLNTVGDTLEHLLGQLALCNVISEESTLLTSSLAFGTGGILCDNGNIKRMRPDSKQQIIICLAQVISDQLAIQPELITQSATWSQLGADSLDRLAISLALEETFHVDIPHQVGEQLNTVGTALDHIWGLVSVPAN